MEAWNIYLSILIDHMPNQAAKLVTYTNALLPLPASNIPLWPGLTTMFNSAHLQHPTRLYAGMSDTLHDLWLQCMTSAKSTQPTCWPCKHCGASDHNYCHHPDCKLAHCCECCGANYSVKDCTMCHTGLASPHTLNHYHGPQYYCSCLNVN